MDTQRTIYVGLSGGVDSSVSAALLKDEGFNVVGVFIRGWYPDFIECTWKEDRRDAMRVCATLDIPFKELDLEKEYKQEVVDYMVEEYKKGRTPNPDIMCNKYIKFGSFLAWAKKQGARAVATGHYARITKENDMYYLREGVDENKDQSYFLWTLTQDKLGDIYFPVGGMQKPDVRAIAEEKGLITADKKDSQGLCFIGHVDIPEFLNHFIQTEPGDVLDEKGNVIGRHEGAEVYTIGQRHGFIIHTQTPEDKPRYVFAKDIENNTISVTDDKEKAGALFNAHEVTLEGISWTTQAPEEGKDYAARIRYRQTPQTCTLVHTGGTWSVRFEDEQKAVASGQSCVIYDGDVCIGGGLIKEIQH